MTAMDSEGLNLKLTRHCRIQNESSAIENLSKLVPEVSKQKLKKAMQLGAVWLTRTSHKQNEYTQRLRRAKKILNVNEQLSIYYDESILFASPTHAQLISDEKDYSVWNKPSGMFSQGTKWGDHNSIARWVELYAFQNRPCFSVHRLDRAANGLILLAHSKKVASQLALLFEKRKVQKHYCAIVDGCFPDSISNIDIAIDGKPASTIILAGTYDSQKNQSELLVQIETGRKHQVRKHLANTGHSIIGDRLYAQPEKLNSQKNLQLTACYLAFECPVHHTNKVFKLPPSI